MTALSGFPHAGIGVALGFDLEKGGRRLPDRALRGSLAGEMKRLVFFTAASICLNAAWIHGAQALAENGTVIKPEGKDPGRLKMALINIKCRYSDTADASTNKANLHGNLDRHMYFIDQVAASGAWFIGPDGRTLEQMPTSSQKADSKECVLIYDVRIAGH